MLELYVQIKEDLTSIMDYMNIEQKDAVKQPAQVTRGYDRVYEQASEITLLYEEIQFNRGVAIMEYIQALRLVKRQRKMDFRKKIKSCALKFEKVHEACGIQQCIDLARQIFDLPAAKDPQADGKADGNEQTFGALQKRKWQSGTEDREDNIKCVQFLEASLKNLIESKDQQVKDFVKYRQENKIPHLSANLKLAVAEKKATAGQQDQKVQNVIKVDKVLNMLLNPQFQHTYTKEI